MVKYRSSRPASAAGLDVVFGALADPTRRAILARLSRGEGSVGELAEPFRMSLPAVSKHLRILGRAGLVARRKDGRVHRCRLEARPLREAMEWMVRYRRFWEEQFDALASYLGELKGEQAQKEEESSWQAPSPARKVRFTSAGPSRPRARTSTRPGRNRKS